MKGHNLIYHCFCIIYCKAENGIYYPRSYSPLLKPDMKHSNLHRRVWGKLLPLSHHHYYLVLYTFISLVCQGPKNET